MVCRRSAPECIENRNPIAGTTGFPYTLSLFRVLSRPNLEETKLSRIQAMPRLAELPESFREKLMAKEVHLALVRFAIEEPNDPVRWLDDPTTEQMDAYRTHLNRLIELPQATGAEHFILAAVPISVQVGTEQFEELSTMGFNVFGTWWVIYRNRRPSRRSCQTYTQNPSHTQALPPIFRAQDERLYLEYDGHINANGHRVIAEVLAAVL